MRVWTNAKFNNLVICEREMYLFRRVEHTAFVLNFVLVFVPNLSNSRLTVHVYIKEGVL